ncbi:MAG: hypothetical protein M1158_02680 [Candidatus Marsarchaeota archaeon]|nr:hypothetical protein [Candidatus Marsarchaeota archaeon]
MGEADRPEGIDMDFRLAVPKAASRSGMTKITSVRRGMGRAKYSSLITTIPAEFCRLYGIGAGDSLMWMLAKGSNAMTVAKVSAGAAAAAGHGSAIYTMMDEYLEKHGELDKETKEVLRTAIDAMKAAGPVRRLTPEEMRKEYLAMRRDIAKGARKEEKRAKKGKE